MEENNTVRLFNTESTSNQENPKAEWEQKLEELLRDAYTRGLATGGKAFVGAIYEAILEDRSKNQNPAKTVVRIELMCKRMLDVAEKSDKR